MASMIGETERFQFYLIRMLIPAQCGSGVQLPGFERKEFCEFSWQWLAKRDVRSRPITVCTPGWVSITVPAVRDVDISRKGSLR